MNSMADQICELKTANKNSYTSGKRYSNQTGNATPIRRRGLVCYHCFKPGHRFDDCETINPKAREHIVKQLKERTFDFSKLDNVTNDNNRKSVTFADKNYLNSKPQSSCTD